MREEIDAGRTVKVMEMSGDLAHKARTHAAKRPVLHDLIASDLVSGHAVFIVPPGREELAADLWRAFDAGSPPSWLPEHTSVMLWHPLRELGGEGGGADE